MSKVKKFEIIEDASLNLDWSLPTGVMPLSDEELQLLRGGTEGCFIRRGSCTGGCFINSQRRFAEKISKIIN